MNNALNNEELTNKVAVLEELPVILGIYHSK